MTEARDTENTPLNKCRCGGKPAFAQIFMPGTHGSREKGWRVSCSCGMQTREFVEGYSGSAHECRRAAADIWNKWSEKV